MERLTMLLGDVLNELGLSLALCTARDWAYVQSRVKHEGVSFLTITLPTFGSSLEEAIERGYALRSDFPSFGNNRSGCLPRFLSGFTALVFQEDGAIRASACPYSIGAIRQIAYLFKKVRLACSDTRMKAALDSYVANEASLVRAEETISTQFDPILDLTASLIVKGLFSNVDREELVSDHGPGATAEHLGANARRRIQRWPSRSEGSFPCELHGVPNWGFYDALQGIESLDVRDEPPVRVVFVPKTLKTPRVIAIEPSHMQYMQQGLMAYTYDRVESHPLTRESVRFLDQSVNHDAARLASIDRRRVTIDMKDASDLVSLALVQRIFRNSPFLDYLEDCRSLHARLPDGRSVIMRKFASMGSAMCFPTEALVFYILIQAAIHEHLGLTPTYRSIVKHSRTIDVYGDDIIIPRHLHKPVVSKLEAYALRVNQRKSFAESHFRESCGGDFYKGISVAPIYVREVIPDRSNRWTAKQVMSLTATSNKFYLAGLWKSAQRLRDWVEEEVKIKVPRSTKDIGGLYFLSLFRNTYGRWNPDLQVLERRTICYRPKRVADDVSDDAVASTFIYLRNIRGGDPFGSPSLVSNETSVKSGSFRKTIRWIL